MTSGYFLASSARLIGLRHNDADYVSGLGENSDHASVPIVYRFRSVFASKISVSPKMGFTQTTCAKTVEDP